MESKPAARERKARQPLKETTNLSQTSTTRPKRVRNTRKDLVEADPIEAKVCIQLPSDLVRIERIFNAISSFLGLFEPKAKPKPTETRGIGTGFSAIAASVKKVTGENLELIDLAVIHELAPRLTAIESKLAFVDYDAQFDDDWARAKDSGGTYLHVSRPHVLYRAPAEDQPGKDVNVYFLLMPFPSLNVVPPKPRKKMDLLFMTRARQEIFHGACLEYIQALKNLGSATLELQLASRKHLPDAIFVESTPRPEPQEGPEGLSWVVKNLFKAPFFKGQVDFKHGVQVVPPRASTHQELRFSLHPHVAHLLPVTGLYSHQAASMDAFQTHSGVAISTSTASGKSLIYQLLILDELAHRGGRAIIVAPTKALAQDQLASFKNLLNRCPALSWAQVNTYDGDTPAETRVQVRESSHIILTNPDMLHHAILPHYTWRSFLSQMTILVLDEMHIYCGTFGQHTALVVRRLLRLTNNVKVIGCSATISGPAEHLSRLTSLPLADLAEISTDGSPSGPKRIILWSSLSRTITESVEILAHFLQSGTRTLAFCPSRNLCETLYSQLKAYCQLRFPPQSAQKHLNQVESYRGGYSLQDRREIEHNFMSGNLTLVIATNALELGVDIGSLEVVVSVGSSFEVACLQQQMGRAGRRGHESLMLILHSHSLDASDQKHMLNNLVARPQYQPLLPELLDPHILELHLQCAANEQPISILIDSRWFGTQLEPICSAYLDLNDPVDHQQGYICKYKYRLNPTQRVQIRGATADPNFRLIDTTQVPHQVLEEIPITRAIYSVYIGGIYIHRGRKYSIKTSCTKSRSAVLEDASDTLYSTVPIRHTVLSLDSCTISRHLTLASTQLVHLGALHLKTIFSGYNRIHPRTREVMEEITYPTHQNPSSIAIKVPCLTLDLLTSPPSFNAAIAHLLTHTIHSTFGSLAKTIQPACCQLTEVDAQHNSLSHRIHLYPGTDSSHPLLSDPDSGIFPQIGSIFSNIMNLIESCPCEDGCSSCIVSSASCKATPSVGLKLKVKNELSTFFAERTPVLA